MTINQKYIFKLNARLSFRSMPTGNETKENKGSFVFDQSKSRAEKFQSPTEVQTKGILLHIFGFFISFSI